jgi:hypothetical protein
MQAALARRGPVLDQYSLGSKMVLSVKYSVTSATGQKPLLDRAAHLNISLNSFLSISRAMHLIGGNQVSTFPRASGSSIDISSPFFTG